MLKFIRVTKKYQSEKPALDNVSFDVDSGELVLITGPSGSGKTTLLKLLTKEQDPSDGEIYFKEENINSLKKSKIPFHRRKIGSVFQDYKLLPELNIWENIALALSILGHPDHEIEEKVTDLLKLVDLTDKAYLFPHQLSGGEAQRISIARALSTAPELIFADEPTGNLDAENSRIVAKLLKKINDLGTTVIVTTHDPVVIKTLSGARKMSLEKGALSDSKPSAKKERTSKSEEKESSEVQKEKKAEDNKDADKEVPSEVQVKKEESLKKKKSSKDEVEKKESSFNFFGLFGKKKKVEKKDSSEVLGEKKADDKKEDKEQSKKQEDKPKKEEEKHASVEDLDDNPKEEEKSKKVKKAK